MPNGYENTNKHPSRFEQISKGAKQVGRVVAFLSREQLDFIDKIGKDALFSTGKKLSRTAIIQAIVEVARKLDISSKDVSSNDELERKMNDAGKEHFPDVVEKLRKGIKHEID